MTRRRLTTVTLEMLRGQLSTRDLAVLADLAKVRVLSGDQLTRLHFADLSPSARDRTRRRVLSRLVGFGLVTTLERRIGGVRAGSGGLIYSLGAAGQRLTAVLVDPSARSANARARHPWTPGRLFLNHTLAISELYVQLREAEQAGRFAILEFRTEPAAWHVDGHGGVIKPDAYAVLQSADVSDSWWLEVDRATESLPTLRRKLLAYTEFARDGQLGPDDVVPRVLVTVPDDHRRAAVQGLIQTLPDPGGQLISVKNHPQATKHMSSVVNNIVD
ncbi:replication-relaxation family protein [Amycolatopsis sp. NPDC059657]|uniref:replication-relaxation family protein n=1 Tax=Amycolatopsis sp. NPDC059657 TaxID=3346899 RepID=UPI00366C4395